MENGALYSVAGHRGLEGHTTTLEVFFRMTAPDAEQSRHESAGAAASQGAVSLRLPNVMRRKGCRTIGELRIGAARTRAAHAGMVFEETANGVAAAARASSGTGTRTNSTPVAP